MPVKPAADLGNAQRISAACAAVCGLAAVAIPLGLTVQWAFLSPDALRATHILRAATVPASLELWQRLAGLAVSLVPGGLVSYALIRARRSLTAFARGEFFASDVAAGVRAYAAATFWAVLASLVAIPVLSVIVTWTNPAHHRELVLGLSSSDVFGVIGCGITWVLAAAMARASALARENAQFV